MKDNVVLTIQKLYTEIDNSFLISDMELKMRRQLAEDYELSFLYGKKAMGLWTKNQ